MVLKNKKYPFLDFYHKQQGKVLVPHLLAKVTVFIFYCVYSDTVNIKTATYTVLLTAYNLKDTDKEFGIHIYLQE